MTKINSSMYNIQQKWLEEIAPKYFNMDDTSMLKAGLFGYVNEVMSNSVEDNINMFSIMSNEIFPNRAVLPNSIYAYSSLAEFDNFNAQPAIIPFVLALRKEDIIKNAEPKNGYSELIISRFSKLMIEDKYAFMVDYDIRVVATPTQDKKDYILSAQYIIDNKNPISNIKNPYIKTVLTSELGEDFLLIRLIGRQLERIEKRFMIYSNDVVENLNFECEFEGKLASFNVYYKEPNAVSFSQLNKYFVDTYKPEDKRFCFYSYPSQQKINVSFSAHPSFFRPEFNSEVLVEIFTTQGAEGNFTYKGTNAQFIFFEGENANYSNILSYTQVLGDSLEGLDRMEISDIKKNVIREFSSRGNLITDIDLNNYFESKSKNCKILFSKKRDDIIERLYSSYLLMKDSNNGIIPTNTVNILVRDYQFDDFQSKSTIHTIKAGTMFELYDLDSNTYTIPKRQYPLDELVRKDSSKDNFIYGNPFLIKVTTDPHFVSYYLNSIFDTYAMEFKYLNKESLNEYIINSVDIERNAMKTDKYKVRFELFTSLLPEQIFSKDKDENLVDAKNLVAKCMIRENGKYTGYFNFDLVGTTEQGNYIFEAELETNDYISTNDQLSLINSVNSLGGRVEVLKQTFNISNDDVQFELATFFNGYDNKSKGLLTDLVPELDDYCLTNLYTSEQNIELFKNLNNIMKSNILTKVEANYTNLFYKLKSVPMVRYLYLLNDENMKEIIRLIDYFKDILTESLNVVENNFNIDMKFYNTFGPSKFFTIGTQKDDLDKISVGIRFNIKFYGDIKSELIQEVKKYITDFVENTNSKESNFLYISNLTRNLEQRFQDIIYLEFLGFNDYSSSNQIVENNFTDLYSLSKEQVINFIPEYLNVNRFAKLENGNVKFEPQVNINLL